MKTIRLLSALAALTVLVALPPAPASANVIWDWTFTDVAGDNASGTLTTNDLSAGSYLITAITGTWNGMAILGLDPLVTCCLPPFNDNLLLAGTPQLDLGGFAFSVSGGPDENIYNGLGGPNDAVVALGGVPIRGTFTARIPEPATLALLGLGLAGLGFSRRRMLN